MMHIDPIDQMLIKMFMLRKRILECSFSHTLFFLIRIDGFPSFLTSERDRLLFVPGKKNSPSELVD